jgi:hypothetical protein
MPDARCLVGDGTKLKDGVTVGVAVDSAVKWNWSDEAKLEWDGDGAGATAGTPTTGRTMATASVKAQRLHYG